MPKALILNGKVVDIADQQFDVHSDFTWVDCDASVTTQHTYDGSSFSAPASPTPEQKLQELRDKRDAKLSQTDWWASSDLTMTQAQIDYRQALRDITDNATGLDDVTWPTKP